MGLKLLVITPVYPHPRAGVFPGIERYCSEMIRALARRGVEIKVITSFWNRGTNHEFVDGIEINRVRDTSTLAGRAGKVFDLHYYTLGKNVFNQGRELISWADSIHTLMPLSSANAVSRSKPLISHFHHPTTYARVSDLLYLPFHRRIESSTYALSKAVLAHSAFSADLVTRLYNVERSRVVTVYPGIDADRFAPARSRRGVSAVHLLYVGVLEKRKGLVYLLRAVRIVKSQGANIILTLVGTGPEGVTLKADANALGIERCVHFVEIPFFKIEDLVRYYNSADIFVFPSLMEGFGQAVAEAMSCGLPVIVSDRASLPEVVGDAGIVVNPESPRELAAALTRLIYDEGLRQDLGKRGRRRVVDTFRWEASAEKLIEVYRGLQAS
jgi:glycosyltransferase involved in cell wall biosynthesis